MIEPAGDILENSVALLGIYYSVVRNFPSVLRNIPFLMEYSYWLLLPS
jgi:hypothetical protein